MSIKAISLKESLGSIKSWLPVLTIFAGVLIFAICRARVFPLENADEADYMLRGYKNLWPAWGPLYSLWYRFLAYFSSDAVLIYRFNHGLLLFASSLLVATALILNGVEKTKASLVGAFFLCWYSWTAETFFVNHFNIVLILLALLATIKLRQSAEKLLWFGVLTLPTVYCRQNNLPVSVACILLGLISLGMSREKIKFHVIPSSILILSCMGLFLAWKPFKASRAWGAFSGNFWRQASSERVTYSEFISARFGEVQSIGGAAKANPQVFWDYMKENFFRLVDFNQNFLFQFEVFLAVSLLLGLVLLYLPIWSNKTSDKTTEQPRSLTANLGVVSLLFCISAFLTVLIFGSIFHYYAEGVVFGGMALVWYFSPLHRPTYAKQMLVAILAFVGLAYQANQTELWIRKFPPVVREMAPIVETLRKVPKDRRKSFVLDNALPMFLGDNDWKVFGIKERAPRNADQWFQQLREFKADVIIISDSFLKRLEMDFGRESRAIKLTQLVEHCYDKFEIPVADAVTSVHVRRKDCSN